MRNRRSGSFNFADTVENLMKMAREEAVRSRRARLLRKHKEFSAFHEITRVIRGDRHNKHTEPPIQIPLVEAVELYNDIEDSTTDASSTIVESDMDHLDRVDSGREEHLVAKRALPTHRSVDREDPLTLSLHISRVPPKSWEFEAMSLTTELDSPVSSVGTFGPQEPSPPREMPHLIESPTENQFEYPSESSDQLSDNFEYPTRSSDMRSAVSHNQVNHFPQVPPHMQFQPHQPLCLPVPPVSSPLWQPVPPRPPVAVQSLQQVVPHSRRLRTHTSEHTESESEFRSVSAASYATAALSGDTHTASASTRIRERI